MQSRRLATVVVVVLVLAFLVVAVAPAFAAAPASVPLHARLVGSTPGDGSTVTTAREVTLTFTEDVDPTFVDVTVRGPAGSEAAGVPAVDGRRVTQALTGDLAAGAHVATYRVVSTDGHPVSGRVAFTTTAAPTASGEATVSASAGPPTAATSAAAGSPTAATSPAAGSPTAATSPAAGASSRRWGWLLGLGALVSLVAAGVSWRHRGGPRADAVAGGARERAGAGGDDPLPTTRDGHAGPFA